MGISHPAQSAEAASVLVLGDSLSAAYGLADSSKGWVALLQEKLRARNIAVVNASIPGDTSAGGRARLAPALAAHHPRIVILELGANDGLRGLPPSTLKANLGAMVDQARSAGAQVLILGMKLPPNYGNRYAEAFERVYDDLAKEKKVEVLPFFLDGVGGNDHLVQPDGLHPNAEAQPILMNNVLDRLDPILTSIK
ncbi:arylesterase [Methylococcus geothermalis]|uniref:arylesterase n=1 Tax=Methylococcus geothermalis TaxID=2681310 RepID=UPI001E285262|nr:arylesterase [Methylococcus geothermalis]